MILKPEPTFEDNLHVARNLRADDKEELSATMFDASPEKLAHHASSSGAFRWGAYDKTDRPVALIGAIPKWPNVWAVWAYGTDEWPKAAILLSRHVRRFMLPALYNQGVIRADCQALETHTSARRWLQMLGAVEEFKMDNWGKNGETFVSYAWTRETTKQILVKAGRI